MLRYITYMAFNNLGRWQMRNMTHVETGIIGSTGSHTHMRILLRAPNSIELVTSNKYTCSEPVIKESRYEKK